MTTAIRRRRGTTTQHSTFTGLEGEVTVDTTKDTLVVHDGSTAGGHPLAKENNATLAGNVTLSGGTTNGVAYLNGSKVVTTGSALTFDGTNLGLSSSAVATAIKIDGSGRYKQFETYQSGSREFYFGYDSTSLIGLIYQDNNRPIAFGISGSEQMRLTSTGLGIGTSSPSSKLQVNGNLRVEGATSEILMAVGAERTISASGSASSTALTFKRWNGSTYVNDVVMDGSGNLGIGTSSPTVNLHVYNASSAEIRIASANIGLQLYSSEGAGTSVIGTYTNHALVFRTNATERARITSGGEVYIAGTTDQGAYNLQVNGTGVWGAGAYVNGSDARLKEEVQDLAPALDVIASLRPVTFRYKEDYSKDQNVQPGFIAQELQTAMAGQAYVDGVIQSGPQHLNVAYQSLIPLLTKAIQELKAEFDAYKATHP